MSSKRHSRPPSRDRSPPKANRRRRIALRWLWLTIAALIGGGTLVYLARPRVPDPPVIALEKLPRGSATVVEKHLAELKAAPRSGVAWGRLGSLLRLLELNIEARQCFTTAERLEPREPRWPYLHGLLLEPVASAEAESKHRRAVALCGNVPDAPRRRLARLLAETGRREEARRELLELLAVQPDNAPARLALAQVAHAQGSLAEAVTLAGRCINDRTTARTAWALLSVAHRRLGETNLARAAALKAESLPPDLPTPDPFESEARALLRSPRDLSDYATRLLANRQLTEAEPIIRQLVADQPGFAEGWLLLGRLQLLQGAPDAAEETIRRHLAIDPRSVNGLFQLGMTLLTQERPADAAQVFERATQLKPDFGPAHYNLGLARMRSGQLQKSTGAFREAIRLNPERIDSHLLLAEVLWQLGEQAEAVERLRQAELLNPGDPRVVKLRDKWSAR